jgi:hypothetical protein
MRYIRKCTERFVLHVSGMNVRHPRLKFHQ